MKKLLALSFGLTISLDVFALGFKESIEKAYENNPKIKASQEEYIKTIQNFPMAISGFLPDVRISMTESDQKSRNTSPINNEARGNSFQKNLTVSQNLFSGGKNIAQLATAKYYVQSAKYKYFLDEQQFILDGLQSYVEFIAAKEKFKASENYVASSEKEYQAMEERLKVGEVTSTDVAMAKAQHSKALAENAKNHQDLLSKQSKYKSFFGDLPSEDIAMPDLPQNLPGSFEEYSEKTKINNFTIGILDSNQKATKNSLRTQQSSILPSLDAQATTGQSYSSGDNTGGVKSKQRSYTTSISLTIPIFSQGGAEYSRIRGSKSDLRRTIYENENKKKDLDTRILDTWEMYNYSKKALQYTKDAVSAQELGYEGMRAKYDLGLVSIIDLLKAENDLYEVRVANISYQTQELFSAYRLLSEMSKLTAKDMELKVKYFDPDSEFNKTKFKVIGF